LRSSFLRAVVFVLAVVVTVIGAAGSAYLTHEYLHLADKAKADVSEEEMGWFERVCTSFATSSCEEVSQSPWGRFPFGQEKGKPSIPTAELGLVYFIFVFCWLVLIGPSRWWIHLMFATCTAAGLGMSIFLDYVMWTALDYWCPICLLTHTASLLVFVFALLLWPRAPKPAASADFVPMRLKALEGKEVVGGELTPDMPSGGIGAAGGPPEPPEPLLPWPGWRAVWTTFLVAALAIGLQHFVWMTTAGKIQIDRLQDESKCQKQLKSAKMVGAYWKKEFERYNKRWELVYWAWRLEPAVPLSLENEPVRGPKNARHTIVLFSDLQCPACGKLEETIREHIIPMGKKYGGIKVVFKHWPICMECNPYAKVDRHPKACLAARAAEAARILGGDEAFWKMHDLLIARRTEMKEVQQDWFVDRGKGLGFDPEAFRQAMDSDEAMARIRAHIEEAENLGRGVVAEDKLEDLKINSTPTVFVNNRRLRTTHYRKAWQMILRSKPRPASRPATTRPKSAAPATKPADGSR